MSSKLSVNVKYPEIVVPDTDVPGADTPDTGMFSVSHNDMASNTNNMVVPIISVSIVVLVLVALVISAFKHHKHKKNNKFSIHTGKGALLRFTGLLALILVATFVFIKYNEKQDNNVNATGTNTNTNTELSITTEDIDINVTLDDTPVFATTKSTVTVNAATTNGYTLMAYVDSNTSDLTNETNTNATTKITGLESSYSQPLTENTWGVALSLPENQDAPVFHGLPTKKEDAMMIKVTGSTATNANDTTELYYATYVTPDLEEGTYTGATVNYVAVTSPTTDDEITVRYNVFNPNTYDFELFNTVTYGLDCSMTYIGDNCRKVYAGESMALNAADGAIGTLPTFEQFENLEGSLNPIAYEGVDGVKVAIDYRGEDHFYAVILKGAYPTMTSLITKMQEIESSGGNLNDWIVRVFAPNMVDETEDSLREYYLNGDAFTIISIPIKNENYSAFNYVVTPIFINKPSDINTIETTVCGLADIDDAYDDAEEDDVYFDMIRPITFPGANGLRVEITYNSPSRDDGYFNLTIIEGNWLGFSEPSRYIEIGPFDIDKAGLETYNFDGDTVTFYFFGYFSRANVDDYGFSAKVYPVYDAETESTIPTQTCKLVNKSGTYREPSPDWNWDIPFDYDGDGESDDVYRDIVGEDGILFLLLNNYGIVRGGTVDVFGGAK